MKIVLISGKAESGKDTFHQLAETIITKKNTSFAPERNWKVVRVAFADEVKRVARDMGWNGEKDEKGRSGLILVGDGARECFDPLVWIKKLVKQVDEIRGRGYKENIAIFVTDCRYPNEVDMVKTYFTLKGHDVYAVRINRPNHNSKLTPEQKNNRSETALDDYQAWDYVITNDGALIDFQNEIGKVVKEILK